MASKKKAAGGHRRKNGEKWGNMGIPFGEKWGKMGKNKEKWGKMGENADVAPGVIGGCSSPGGSNPPKSI